jgi:sugar phosphate isomerase/epimerase
MLAVSSASFHHALHRRHMALEDIPAAVHEMGLGAVEVDDAYLIAGPLRQRVFDLFMRRYFGRGTFYRAYTSSRLMALHMAFEDTGVRMAAWRAHTDFTLTGRPARWQMHYLEGAIAAADDFGARIVCIQSGGRPGASEEEIAHCIKALQHAAALASQFHTRLALESGSGLASAPGTMARIVREVQIPSLAACVEFDATSSEIAHLAIHAHARAQAFDAQGREPHADYAACLEALRQTDYQGWLSIQYEGWDDPALGIMQTAELIGAAS